MIKKPNLSASPKAALPPSADLHDVGIDAARPASNASKPMEKSRVRIKAQADQAIIQEQGADALPVSDYPLKQGPMAANAVDLRQRSRAKVKRG